MNDKLTAEECYSIYHHAKMFAQKGIHPKAIKNWDKIKGRPTWPYFEKLADMLHRSAGMIEPKEYIESVVNHFPKSITPKMLTTQKGIKAYKNAVRKDALESTDEYKIGQVKNSILFVVKYCIDNELDTFRDYFHDRAAVFPSMVMHMEGHKISSYFVHLIPNLEGRIMGYPADIRHDYFNEKFWSENSMFNIIANNSDELKKLKSNIEQIVNELIKRNKERNEK